MEAEKKAFKITKREVGFVLGIVVFLLVKFLPLAELSSTVASAFSSWTKATMCLVIGAYVIASAVKESGLGERIAYAFMLKFVRDAKSLTGTRPMRGWGAMLRREALHSDDPIAGAGSFAVLPRGVEEMLPSDPAELAELGVEVLPEGTYLCMSRWGMPYEPEGIRAIVACMDEHALQPIGNAFDFCYLDTTSYDESHQEDFCCIQIPVTLQM